MDCSAQVFTDGSCHTQWCIGGWASIIFIKGEKIMLSGKQENTTHNRMELVAVIKSITYVMEHFVEINKINIVSDSQYVIGLIDRREKFNAGNFKTKAGNDIRNSDLVQELLLLVSVINIEFTKIKAHQKPTDVVNYNNEVDKLARQIVRNAVGEKS